MNEIPKIQIPHTNLPVRDEEVCDQCGQTQKMLHVRERIVRVREALNHQIKMLEHNNNALTMYLMAAIYEHGNGKALRVSELAGNQIEIAIAEGRLNPGIVTEISKIDDTMIIKLESIDAQDLINEGLEEQLAANIEGFQKLGIPVVYLS